ncbi:unnamed protein product [Cuscuta epithymum]|uniref:Uncharacterized protein n=1 Tax=Cuscuta epithymum TaxID=186058 RepID=A0AAV0D723_9ASTE|nr:unnamed protein product [Cuscuta epithymum]
MVCSSANKSSSTLRKGAWTQEEDNILRKCIDKFGEGKWHLVPARAGLNRCRKSCRLRWLNYLRPDIKRGHFGLDEVDLILRLHKLLGNRWSLIAGRIPGRTANDVKNYWNTHLQRKKTEFPMAASSTQEKGKRKKAPNISESSAVIRPRPSRFLINPASRKQSTAGESTDDVPAAQQGTAPPEPPSTSSPVDLRRDDNFHERADLVTNLSPEETLSDTMQWWEDFLVGDEETTSIEEGEIGWGDFPIDVDLLELLS